MATSKRTKAKAAKAKAAEAAETARANAYEAAMAADADAVQAAKIAKRKAREAKKAATTDSAKAKEAEAAAKTAKFMAEEAAKAKEAVEEMSRLEDKETEWALCEEELFASRFRRFWNKFYACRGITFLQTTSIPSMRYTYPASHDTPDAMATLQIKSVKITSIKECLHWPLQVFGIVAARDILDNKRNIIFDRPRNSCQTITREDPYLALTGPSRAIAVSIDPSYIEISLKVKGTTKAEDKDLSDLVVTYRSGYCLTGVYPSRLSTLKFESGHIGFSVEATICIKLTGGSWPIGFRSVFTAGTSADGDLIKLLDTGHDGLPADANGVIKLSRRVVSVGLENFLKVYLMAISINGKLVVENSEATFKPERAGISLIKLSLGCCSMEVTVAWSCFCYG
ncbi:uncharacterized protein LOC123408368 [Hordeum vulgare subsp. vulgare]|uniref:uncharacterized protein LOC123408368 n=1 Tax=Hordeum vulgare subsp. vulgare TaxID=112509 RepID=UPI001D1A39BE|nr:uncharacterized protein LOC123408368 [Hordeum vulgare subsp. vulgare]